MTRLLLYSDLDEPITAIAVKFADQLQLATLDVQELLFESAIADRLDASGAQICWRYRDMHFQNRPETYLLNRCAHLSREWFERFTPSDRDYAQGECHAYLLFALTSFAPRISEVPRQGSLMGRSWTLPEQWMWAQSAFGGLKIPDFHLGDRGALPASWQKSAIIYTDPHNLYTFCPNSPKSQAAACFAFLRPSGVALLCSVVGSSVEIAPLEGQKIAAFVKSGVLERARKLAGEIAAAQEFFAADILLFAHQGSFTLGMFANIPYGSAKLPGFESRVLNQLQELLSPY